MDIYSGADAVRIYNTGAAADGDAQTNAADSLGGYRSGTEVASLALSRSGGSANLTIDFMSGSCGEGSSSVAAISSNSVSFTAPGGSAGPTVTIVNGETKVLVDGTDASKYVRVTRTSAAALSGTISITSVFVSNNAASMPNIGSAQGRIGEVDYSCLAIKNHSSVAVGSVKVYVRPIVSDTLLSDVGQLDDTTGSAITTDAGQLGGSGGGSIRTSTAAAFAAWPQTGMAIIETSGSAVREIVRYEKSGLTHSGSPTNITVNFCSQGNGNGTGVITVNSAGTAVRWTPPGETPGPWTYLASGVSRRVPGPGIAALTKSVWVTCTGALTPDQSTNITITSSYTDTNLYVPPPWRAQGGTSADTGAASDTVTRIPGGTITTSDDFDVAGWPSSGFVRITDSSGVLREICYYSSRSATALTVPEAGRGLFDTAPAAGAASDSLQSVPGIRVGVEAPDAQPDGEFSTIADRIAAPGGSITWTTSTSYADGVEIGVLASGDIYGIWIERACVAGTTPAVRIIQGVGLSFDAA